MTATFSSILASTIRSYLTLKRALGRQYAMHERVLAHLDRFLAARHADLRAETFAVWCLTFQHLASGNRRAHMREVRNLCLYRRRREPGCFVPDERLFPPFHQVVRPHIFTDGQVAQLLAAAQTRTRTANSPLCPDMMRLAIVLLYTTGMRRRELTRLTVGDYDSRERTLLIRESKFHKSRLIPVSTDAAREIDGILDLRRQQRHPTEANSPLLWHRSRGYSGGGLACTVRALFRQAGIRTATGPMPRLHDFRQHAGSGIMPGSNEEAVFLGVVSSISRLPIRHNPPLVFSTARWPRREKTWEIRSLRIATRFRSLASSPRTSTRSPRIWLRAATSPRQFAHG